MLIRKCWPGAQGSLDDISDSNSCAGEQFQEGGQNSLVLSSEDHQECIPT